MQTSALTGFRPVPRVRIHSSPPRSLDCREIPLVLRRNTRTTPVFRDYSLTNRTVENGLLGRSGIGSPVFLRNPSKQSDFKNPLRRTTSDHKPNALRILS